MLKVIALIFFINFLFDSSISFAGFGIKAFGIKVCHNCNGHVTTIIPSPVTVVTAPATVIVAIANNPKDLLEHPKESLSKANEKIKDVAHKTVKEIGHGGDRIIEEVERIILDSGQILFCPKESKIMHYHGHCVDTGGRGLSCTNTTEGTKCQLVDIDGREAGLNVDVTSAERDWDSALSWMKKTELQDYLELLNQSIKSSKNEELKKFLNEDNNIEYFRDLAAASFEEAEQKTLNGTAINVDVEEQANLYQILKGLQELIKGIDNCLIILR